jgi:hypothetical protein
LGPCARPAVADSQQSTATPGNVHYDLVLVLDQTGESNVSSPLVALVRCCSASSQHLSVRNGYLRRVSFLGEASSQPLPFSHSITATHHYSQLQLKLDGSRIPHTVDSADAYRQPRRQGEVASPRCSCHLQQPACSTPSICTITKCMHVSENQETGCSATMGPTLSKMGDVLTVLSSFQVARSFVAPFPKTSQATNVVWSELWERPVHCLVQKHASR